MNGLIRSKMWFFYRYIAELHHRINIKRKSESEKYLLKSLTRILTTHDVIVEVDTDTTRLLNFLPYFFFENFQNSTHETDIFSIS